MASSGRRRLLLLLVGAVAIVQLLQGLCFLALPHISSHARQLRVSRASLSPTSHRDAATNQIDPHQVLEVVGATVPADAFKDKVVVVKYGGHAMKDEGAFARDIIALMSLGVKPVVVHGGGPMIKSMLDQLGMEGRFEQGLRVSDASTVEVAEMVLGRVNKGLVASIVAAGGRAIGLSGKDDGMIRTRRVQALNGVDIGFVGEAAAVDTTLLHALLSMSPPVVPVIAPIGVGLADGATYNVNADAMAGAVAGALQSERLLLLTDVPGVLDAAPPAGKLLPRLTRKDIEGLIADGTVSGGMIPKVEHALGAVEAGAKGASIVDGREQHALFRALFSEVGGTLVQPI